MKSFLDKILEDKGLKNKDMILLVELLKVKGTIEILDYG